MRACRQKWCGRLGAFPEPRELRGRSRSNLASGETVLRGIEQQMLRGRAKRDFVRDCVMEKTDNRTFDCHAEASA